MENGTIVVNNQGVIEKIGKSPALNEGICCSDTIENKNACIIDAEGYLIIPGLVNSHTHVGDAIGKDISSNADLDARVNPNQSVKKTILEKTDAEQLKQSMKNAAISMLNKGITTFVDFREGGLTGVKMLLTAIKDVPIKKIILGRIDFSDYCSSIGDNNYVTINDNTVGECAENKLKHKEEWRVERVYKRGKDLLNLCDGFGISGANECSDEMLAIYKNIARESNKRDVCNKKEKPIVAIHAAESDGAVKESLKKTRRTEIERTIHALNPNLYVHLTNPKTSDIDLLHSANKGVVICPRANGVLGVGFPPVNEMLKRGLTLAMGTDNIMLNSPDMFKEMDFLVRSQRAHQKNVSFLDAKKVLQMATVNGGKIFNRNIGRIENGYQADLVFIDKYDIDMYPMHDPYMSIVSRCSERAIKAIMIGGRFVHDKSRIN
jgi:cytosine/adenosine deaminase-related metal-dependent hydrolase